MQALPGGQRDALDMRVLECTEVTKALSTKLQRLCGYCEALAPRADVQDCLLHLFKESYPAALHDKLPDFLAFLMGM